MRECPVTGANCHNPECLDANWKCSLDDYPFEKKPSQGLRPSTFYVPLTDELKIKVDRLEKELEQCKKDIQELKGLNNP